METYFKDREFVGVNDCILLDNFTCEDSFVDNLRKRFDENIIYTYIGSTLISVNPNKTQKELYEKNVLQSYFKKNFFEMPPHIFAITDTAYRSFRNEHREQCILISGESGSGKTEASKLVLRYIAEATDFKGDISVIKDKLLQSNPVLEAFGNAKTNHNDNSSRFGKFMDIQFNIAGNPSGGSILTYLLEKSRVITQAFGERNFHIFYQILEGADESDLKTYKLDRNFRNYNYLSKGSKQFLIDDKSAYESMRHALNVVNFMEEDQNNIFSIIASILHLGNVQFSHSNNGNSLIQSVDTLDTVAQLLKCDVAILSRALTKRTIETIGDSVQSPLNEETSIYVRDALAKAIYDRMFTWIIQHLNVSLQSQDMAAYKKNSMIGILDIYGFEIFQRNSFEQLCINYCNEKLHQLFIELTLRSEQEEYRQEGIDWEMVEFFNNNIICDLFEHKHQGIIALIDEECLLPGDCNDSTMLAKLTQQLSHHKHFMSHQRANAKLQKLMGRDEFKIIHYAGGVIYNTKGFMDKNNDLLYRDLKDAMAHSKNALIQAIFPLESNEKNTISRKMPQTTLTQFKNSLNNLMTILLDKEPSYIRCIKSNSKKSPGLFDSDLVKEQVRNLGLMENLRICRAGYAYRRLFTLFLERYKCLCPATWPNYKGPIQEAISSLVNYLNYESDDYKLGKTKIFIKYPRVLFRTEDAFQAKKHTIAILIQKIWRGFIQRKKYVTYRQSVIIVQTIVRGFLARKRSDRRRHAVLVLRTLIQGFITRNSPIETESNRRFVNLTRLRWMRMLSGNLPKTIVNRKWPCCPKICDETSSLLNQMHLRQLARNYRLSIGTERKQQMELKVLAEELFAAKKKSYPNSIPQWFVDRRLQNYDLLEKLQQKNMIGDDVKYVSSAIKYDRHGYKPRQRIIVIGSQNLYVLDQRSLKLKHVFRLDMLNVIVTMELDHLMLIRLPEDLINTDKGDLILEVPNLIETLTYLVDTFGGANILTITETNSLEHQMKEGKHGIIDIVNGQEQSIHKAKNGHLVVVNE